MEKTAIGLGADYLYGYVGKERYLIANNVEQICAFIMKHRSSNVVKIINLLDITEIETASGFIYFCNNQEFLSQDLIPVLVPMQMGQVEPPEFTPYVEEFVINNVRLKSGAGYYLGSVDYEMGMSMPYNRSSGYFKTEEDVLKEFPDSISMSEAHEIAVQKGWSN